MEVADNMKQKVFNALRKTWSGTAAEIATEAGVTPGEAAGALSAYTQAGRVIYDINKQLYRLRELSREPLPVEQLRFSNPQEELAAELLTTQEVKFSAVQQDDDQTLLKGTVKGKRKTFTTSMQIDGDERLKTATCDCSYYGENKLRKGPCEHMLAVRQAWSREKVGKTVKF
jgi:hypothetical protein